MIPRPRFTSRLSRLRNAVLGVVLRPFRWFSPASQFVLGFTFLVVVTSLLLARWPITTKSMAVCVVVLAGYFVLWRFVKARATAFDLSISQRRTFALVGSAIVFETAVIRLGFLVAAGLAAQSTQAPLNDPSVWALTIPFAAASLLVTMLLNRQLGLITGVIASIFAGLLAPNPTQAVIYALISCSAAVYGIKRYRERQSVTLAGLVVAGVNCVTALTLIVFAPQPLTLIGTIVAASCHSHAVGQLAEDASRAIGANALLARIGSLYHDIGKVAAPDHFVENQTGRNPHDRLRPVQSAKIITSHVTYGLKLAKEIGLPKRVADFIPQHHGTRTLHFFLQKAQEQAGGGEKINESEFRYPGPKPQFKEAAILMLADSAEAAARSLAHPDPDSVRAIVVRIFDAIITDGQLDESNLTLRELTLIRETLIHSLNALYHARIDYPGFNVAAAPSDEKTKPGEELGVTYENTADVPINPSGEVEDEAISHR